MPHKEMVKQDILRKIKQIAEESGGDAPGQTKFASQTGIKDHVWRGKFWRGWGEALVEAGFAPKAMSTAYTQVQLLGPVIGLARRLDRFPTTGDLAFESNNNSDFPSHKTILARWKMSELAKAVAEYCVQTGDHTIAALARAYTEAQPNEAVRRDDENGGLFQASGYVYLQRHGSDYKIGYTNSLNKRGRQIQLELPQETELLHSILTDDPAGIEAYWHKRFAEKRTRGEWFKLTKADIAAFKRWSKIW